MLLRLFYISVVGLAIAIAIALRWPAADAGLFTDDYAHHAMLDKFGSIKRAPWDLYKLLSGDQRENEIFKEYGTLAWWSHPKARLAMFRPLSSALIVFDHYILGRDTFAYHIHSFIWWAFLIACLAVFLRSLLPLAAAAVAVLLFTVEEGNGMLVLWVANRCALVSLSMALLGLWLYVKWRNQNRKVYFWLSLVLFTIALLSGEWAYPIFGYVLAFELFRTEEPPLQRFRAMVPTFGLGFLFAVATRLLGYGSKYSGIYISPIDDFFGFIYHGTFRLLVLVADLVLGVPSDWWHFGSPFRAFAISLRLFSPPVWRSLPPWEFWHVLLGIASLALAVIVVRWAFAGPEMKANKQIKWLLTGALLALVPMVSPFISSRSVIPAFVGFSALLSVLLIECVGRLYRSVRERQMRTFATSAAVIAYILVFQFLLPAQRSINEITVSSAINRSITRWVLNAEIDDNEVRNQDVFVVDGVDISSTMFAPFIRHFFGRPMARSWRVLSGAGHAHDLTRIAPNVIDLHVLGGTMMETDYEHTCRSDQYPLRANEIVDIKGFKVIVTNSRDGKPSSVRYIFPKSLDDPSYVFLESRAGRLSRLKIPEVGKRIRLRKGQTPLPFATYVHTRRIKGLGTPSPHPPTF
jgi:hypothetical protein